MQPILPFSCLKKFFEGEPFKAVQVGAVWHLQSEDFILSGMENKPYAFTSSANAEYWLESSLFRSAQNRITTAKAIATLTAKHAKMPNDAIVEELATITAKNAGDWFGWNELFIDGGAA